jgi:hypothetical protein
MPTAAASIDQVVEVGTVGAVGSSTVEVGGVRASPAAHVTQKVKTSDVSARGNSKIEIGVISTAQ